MTVNNFLKAVCASWLALLLSSIAHAEPISGWEQWRLGSPLLDEQLRLNELPIPRMTDLSGYSYYLTGRSYILELDQMQFNVYFQVIADSEGEVAAVKLIYHPDEQAGVSKISTQDMGQRLRDYAEDYFDNEWKSHEIELQEDPGILAHLMFDSENGVSLTIAMPDKVILAICTTRYFADWCNVDGSQGPWMGTTAAEE